MIDIINLAAPFFGVILLGYLCGRFKALPEAGLAWMDFFIVYVALPSLFYRIIATTPLEQLANPRFVLATTAATAGILLLSFVIALALRAPIREAGIAALGGAYGNIGYMGPGLAIATLGAQAAAPVALIVTFDNIVMFTFAPLVMALAGATAKPIGGTILGVVRGIALHPFIVATAIGVLVAATGLHPPTAVDRMLQFLQNAAAPCALFTMGVTVALRPFAGVSRETPYLVVLKLLVHPALALLMLSLLGPFERDWVYVAVLMAALPQALNVFVLARQYNVWVGQASSLILIGTLASVPTLTLLMWLVKEGRLPATLLP